MGIGRDCAIFVNINSDKYTDVEKFAAIRNVVDMPTHMGIKKDDMLEVIKYALRKAAEYDKAREDGRMVVLPCKVGDTAYFILPAFDQENIFEELYVSEPHKITEAGTRGFWTSAIPNEKPDAMHNFTDWSDFGRTVFLTREEAEAALGGGDGE